jgi:hypothetical protein
MTLDFHGTGITVYGAKRGNHGTYSGTSRITVLKGAEYDSDS